ncbi:ABC-F family ATP-binding cassette domain-containing protein [Treponema pallidum]|uniref:Probable ATP-binding protein YbiT n=2 Tax=Treponema pallidum TaxID=160 RepID=A0AAU8S6M6_TREPL|nr:ABC-F family ATP-binding cassette domain-containing protein [Treponema pallidum]AEZ57970.1 ABC superfamily ATP binding cassette transporter, ABC protein [Treponema pallidum subsp. pertenue str. SamoaD]AEZ59039.1 ABC superfamily ATP binding cassette transporter, ABC protein [Treponema pallidum subsp. pertenue str. CDC2]AEZ60107.1 ABC superfamily ATP binding cassette transporter, ABC protein [Treponema pallidum subsp. pertenue str. Gauthier]AGK84491.1 ABC superfamily ATP binding cassette trans
MITVTGMSVQFSDKPLFKGVDLKFVAGNCYGVIGANGAGKSTFLKVLSGELEHHQGSIAIASGARVAVLRQDHFSFDQHTVKDTVCMGHPALYRVMKEREALYAKSDFSEADGLKASELEGEFSDLNGWEAENCIEQMLSGLGVDEAHHDRMMCELDESQKVRVLLAQALFGNPDVLLLDEPTNGLDLYSIAWLEEFLIEFPNTVIVVSHDRHFLNSVCTHICDIDYGKIRLYSGNYDFWYQMSQIMQRQVKDQQKKREEKMKDLREFILRFASNAAKSRQATSRKKIYDKLVLEEIEVTGRKFPYVHFKPRREIGNHVLSCDGLRYAAEDRMQGGSCELFTDMSFTVGRTDKIAFVGQEHRAKTILFDILAGEKQAHAGSFRWGQTVSVGYMGKDTARYFDCDLSITDWLRQFSDDQDETYVRGFLGRMLFTGEDSLKSVRVLSGGEKVRCMLSKLMLSGSNVLILDEPTNHLDLEAIASLNEALVQFPGVILFNSHDHEFVSSVANRIVEITPRGIIDRMMDFDSYVKSEDVNATRAQLYGGSVQQLRI